MHVSSAWFAHICSQSLVSYWGPTMEGWKKRNIKYIYKWNSNGFPLRLRQPSFVSLRRAEFVYGGASTTEDVTIRITSYEKAFFSSLWSVYNLPAHRKLNPPCFHWPTKAQIQWSWKGGLALTLLQMTYKPYRSHDCQLLWVMSGGIVIWDSKVKWFSIEALRQQWQ